MYFTPSQKIIALAVKYEGDYSLTYAALKRREILPDEETDAILRGIKSKVVTILDPEYPRTLFDSCPRPPLALFYYGDLSLAYDDKIITVVGSREPTPYAASKTEEICAEAARNGFIICSGLAKGIDTCAAKATSSFPGKSIAVLGCGIDRCYPAENEALRDLIAANGLLISEYPGITPPSLISFPSRNRIVACLGAATLASEVRPHSGTLITVGLAMQMSRDVGVLPYEAGSGFENNTLIKYGAAIIEDFSDLRLLLPSRPSDDSTEVKKS